MRFLIDAQLPPDRARWLRDQGHDAFHVYELNMRFSADTEIWL
jgi:predicted nuclease of predicted toxin-antitoxin system